MGSYYEKHLREKYPNMEPVLLRRFASANMSRRRRFAYWRTRHEKLADSAPKQAKRRVPEPTEPLLEVQNRKLITTATILQPRMLQNRHELDAVSMTSYNTYATDEDDVVQIPDMPRDARNGEEFQCPYCFLVLESMPRSAWRYVRRRCCHPFLDTIHR
jgi:hypothetical protein